MAYHFWITYSVYQSFIRILLSYHVPAMSFFGSSFSRNYGGRLIGFRNLALDTPSALNIFYLSSFIFFFIIQDLPYMSSPHGRTPWPSYIKYPPSFFITLRNCNFFLFSNHFVKIVDVFVYLFIICSFYQDVSSVRAEILVCLITHNVSRA